MRRVRRLYLYALAAVAILAVAVLAGLRDVGDDSPEQAIYAVAHAVEHENAEDACERLVSAEELPAAVRAALALESNADAPARSCRERFALLERVGGPGFTDVLVDDVRPVKVETSGPVSGAARADVRLDRTRPARIVLVRHDGRWKVVDPASSM